MAPLVYKKVPPTEIENPQLGLLLLVPNASFSSVGTSGAVQRSLLTPCPGRQWRIRPVHEGARPICARKSLQLMEDHGAPLHLRRPSGRSSQPPNEPLDIFWCPWGVHTVD